MARRIRSVKPEWLERTKEQASRDKARDRAIQAEGWKVFRFTGSDVWHHADRCVAEVVEVLRKNEREWMDA